jgi:hypothetical protein
LSPRRTGSEALRPELQITGERFDQVPGHTLADFLALMAAEEHAIKNVQSHAAK